MQERFLSLSMVLGVAFLLLVSLIASAILSAIGGLLGDYQTGIIRHVLTTALDLMVITLLSALIFRFLPDAQIAWRDVWFGARRLSPSDSASTMTRPSGRALAGHNAASKGHRLGIFKPHEEKPRKARENEHGEQFLVELFLAEQALNGRFPPRTHTGRPRST